jgi:hypothetical protein
MNGVEGLIVRVETDAFPGTPSLTIIGLPDRSLHESKDRVRAALGNSGFALPAGRLLISLAPAHVRLRIEFKPFGLKLDTKRSQLNTVQGLAGQ